MSTKVQLAWLTRFTAVMTVFLLTAGALVTGTGSGLAVPDWPLSFGQFFPPMVGGVFFEHGHRLIAAAVAFLTIIQAIQLQCFESRQWVKTLGWAAVGAVLLQATLGGITVLWRLPRAVSVTHACLAQLFFCATLVLALVTAKNWKENSRKIKTEASVFPFPYFSLLVTLLFFLQLVLGATMRHFGAGLAIPDFPTAFGGFIPPEFDFKIAVHFLHRLGAFSLVFLVSLLVIRVLSFHSSFSPLVINVGILALLVSLQLMLGAMVIWIRRPVQLTTAHLVLGALCFGTSVLLTLQSFHYLEIHWKKMGWFPGVDSLSQTAEVER